MEERMKACEILNVGKRRDGGYRFWCVEHRANATAKYGKASKVCVAAHDAPLNPEDTLELDISKYPGGVRLWGAVPAVYDTTTLSPDRGIHVHARMSQTGSKSIDRTFRAINLNAKGADLFESVLLVHEIDAINYMISRAFDFDVHSVNCTFCRFPHLDRDWFAVHPHRRHQCHGCGRQFTGPKKGIGNPLATLIDVVKSKPMSLDSPRRLCIDQSDPKFAGGLQIWASNPAFLNSSTGKIDDGIHLHAYFDKDNLETSLDETYQEIEIDGIKLDSLQVRNYMAQSAMPHLYGRIVHAECNRCGAKHFDIGENAFTPHVLHVCDTCSQSFTAKGRVKKVICNPFVDVRRLLATTAPNPLKSERLDLRAETI
jgi:transposase-like protein